MVRYCERMKNISNGGKRESIKYTYFSFFLLLLLFQNQESIYDLEEAFQCLKCAPGCESCVDSSPCIVTLNWVLRTILLILQCIIIGCLPIVVLFTYKYKDIKVTQKKYFEIF